MIAARIAELLRRRADGRGGDAPLPTRESPVVIVACPCMRGERSGIAGRLGLDAAGVAVVLVPAARVPTPDGETSRAVALVCEQRHAQNVLVLGHEDCPFDGAPMGVPGTAPGWPETGSGTGCVAASLSNLVASPWRRSGVAIEGLVLLRSGGVEPVAPAPHAASAGGHPSSSLAPPPFPSAPAFPAAPTHYAGTPQSLGGGGGIAAPGPVSFFGSPGAVTSMGATAPPLASPRWDMPPPMPVTPSPSILPGVGSGLPPLAPLPSLGPLPPMAPATMPEFSITDTPAPDRLPPIERLARVVPLEAIHSSPVQMPDRANTSSLDVRQPEAAAPTGPTAPQPPRDRPRPPKPAPQAEPERTRDPDDPFDRAEAVLDKLRRRRNP